MDAEHRHELKSNELAEWIGKIPGWIKENSNFVIGIVLIVLALISWPMLNKMAKQKDISELAQTTNSIQMLEGDVMKAVTDKSQDQQAREQAMSMLLVNADSLLEKADKLDNKNLAALSRIKAAQTIRTELQIRREEVSAQTLEEQVKKAKDAYQKAYDEATFAPVKGLAQLGLGLCAEDLGQTEEAKDIYNKIVENKDYAATVVPAQAKNRLDVLADGVSKVYFAPAPKQEEAAPAVSPEAQAPATQAPATAPAPEPAAESKSAREQEAAEEAEAVDIPAEQKAQAEEMVREQKQEGTNMPAEIPAQQAPVEQNAAPNE